jgi:hypothetical protein
MDMQTLKLLIEALRSRVDSTTTPLTGPNAGQVRPAGPPTASPAMLGPGMAGQAAAALQNNPARY